MAISDLEFSIRSAEAALRPALQFDFSCFLPLPSQGHAVINNLQAELCLKILFLRKLSPQQGWSDLFIGNRVYLRVFIYHGSFSQ